MRKSLYGIALVLILFLSPWVHAAQMTVAWTDASTTETGFEIERSTTAGTGFAKVGTVGANIETWTDPALPELVRFYYRVRAVNAAGPSGYSNEASAVTRASLPLPVTTISLATFPMEIRVTWNDSNNETRFELERSLTGTLTDFALIATIAANVLSYADTGLAEGQRYYYRLRPCNSAGCAVYSAIANATTPLNVPATPGNLTVTPLP